MQDNTLPAPTEDIAVGKRDLDEYGYAIHQNALTGDQVLALRDRLDEQAEMERQTGVASFDMDGYHSMELQLGSPPAGALPAYQQVLFLPMKGQVFLDLLLLPVAKTYLDHVLVGQPYTIGMMSGIIVRRTRKPMVIHNDQQPLPFSTATPTGLNIMYCLSDFTKALGATKVIPKTHCEPSPEIIFDDAGAPIPPNRETVTVEAPAGSAIMWESRLWHAQGDSTSDEARYSIRANHVMHFMKPDDNYPALLPDDIYLSLNDRQKILLGFEATGYGGRLAPRTPADPRGNTDHPQPYIPALYR